MDQESSFGSAARAISNPCNVCGRLPSRTVSFHRNVGLVFARRIHTFQGDLCRSCGRGVYRDFQHRNIALGPWGLISFFATLYYLANNAIHAASFRRDLDTPQPSDPELERKLQGRPVLLRPGGLALIALLGFLVVSGMMNSGNADSELEEADWRVGACVVFEGSIANPVPCGSTEHDATVTRIVASETACPDTTRWWVEVDDQTVACLEE